MNTKHTFKRPNLWMRSRLRWHKLAKGWPALVWLGAIFIVITLYTRHAEFGSMAGVVDTVAEPIAPLETARLIDIYVRIGQHVKAGEKLAQMDTSRIDAELASMEATAIDSRNSMGQFERNTLSIAKNFDEAILTERSSIENLKRQQDRDTALLAQLEKQQDRFDKLFSKKLIDEVTASKLKPQIAGLKQELVSYPTMIIIAQKRLDEAIKSKEALQESLHLRPNEDIRAALRRRSNDQEGIFKASRHAVDLRRDRYTLRAANNGIVSRILHHQGHVVTGGAPVIRLITANPSAIIGFLPESYAASLKLGQGAHVWRSSGIRKRHRAKIVSIAPEIDTLPTRLGNVNNQTIRGRRVIIELTGPHDLLPGETVQITPMGVPTGLDLWLNRLIKGPPVKDEPEGVTP